MDDPYVALLNARAIDDSEDEQIQRSLSLVRAQGDAYGEALEYLSEHVARDRGQTHTGDFWVSFLVYPPDARAQGGDRSDPAETAEIGVTVRDAFDGRFVPDADVQVTLVDASGDSHGPHQHPMRWHPIFYQYLRCWDLSGPAPHRLLITVAPPTSDDSRSVTPRLHTLLELRFDDVDLYGSAA